VNCSVI